MSKSKIIKILAFVLITLILLFLNSILPLATARSAVGQLQDSNEAYIQFKLMQKSPVILLAIWIVSGLLIFSKDIIKLLKKGNK